MENEEFRLLMKARQNVYDLLRCFFLQEPAEEFLNALKEENILKDLMGYNKDLDEGVELVSSALSSPDLAGLASVLQEEFTRLFVGPLPIPLYESVFRSESGLVNQEETAPSGGNTWRPDFSFTPTVLSRKTISAPNSNSSIFSAKGRLGRRGSGAEIIFSRRSRSFCGITLSVWIAPFCDRLFSAAGSSYFRGAAKMTKGFVTWDFEELLSNFEE